MTDIAPVGFSVDTSGLEEANAQLDAFNAKQQQVAAGSEQVAGATPAASTALKDFAGSAATAGTASEAAEARIAALSLGMGQMTEAATASALSLQGIKAYAAESAASLALLTSAHGAAGNSARAAAGEFSGLSSSSRAAREAFHLGAFELEQFGGSMAGLRGVAILARGGIEILAGALGTALVIAMENAGDKAEALHSRIGAVFGGASGQAFDAMSAAAEHLHTSVADIEPAVETAYTALLRLQSAGSLAAGDRLKGMGFGFAPGAGGQAAQDALVAMNQQKLDPQAAADVKNLGAVFRAAGENISTAQQHAKTFFDSVQKDAQQASVTATADMNKLFQVAGIADSGKAVDDFFKKVEQGGMTFRDVAGLPPQVGNAIAQAFGFTGQGAVERFEAELERVKSVSIVDLMAGLVSITPAIDAMTVPESIQNSWNALVTSVKALAETGGGGSAVKTFLNDLNADVKDLTANWDSFVSSLHLGDLGDIGNFIKSQLNRTMDTFQGKQQPDQTDIFQATGNMFGVPALPEGGGLNRFIGQPPAAMPAQSTATTGIPVDIVGVGTSSSPITASTGALNGLPVSIVGTSPTDQTSQTAPMPAQQAAEAPGSTVSSTATDQAAQALDQLGTSAQTVAGPADAAASGLSSVGTAAQDTTTQSGALSTALSDISGALSSAGSAVASFLASVEAAASGLGSGSSGGASSGGGSYGDQTGIQAGQPVANIGSNATGGVYKVGGSGGTDSISLTGMVSPGETIAVIPPGMATAAVLNPLQTAVGQGVMPFSPGDQIGSLSDSVALTGQVSPGETIAVLPPELATSDLLSLLQGAIGTSPINVSASGSSAASDIGANSPGGIYTIAQPQSATAQALSGIAAGAPPANASAALASALAGRAASTGSPLGLTSAQAQAALAQVAAGVPARTASGTSKSAGSGGGGGSVKIIDKNPWDAFAAAGFSDDPFAGFSGDPFSVLKGGGGGGSRGKASASSRAASGMVLNPDGSWSPAGMGHGMAPSISGGDGGGGGKASATSRAASGAAGDASLWDQFKSAPGLPPSPSNMMAGGGNPTDYLTSSSPAGASWSTAMSAGNPFTDLSAADLVTEGNVLAATYGWASPASYASREAINASEAAWLGGMSPPFGSALAKASGYTDIPLNYITPINNDPPFGSALARQMGYTDVPVAPGYTPDPPFGSALARQMGHTDVRASPGYTSATNASPVFNASGADFPTDMSGSFPSFDAGTPPSFDPSSFDYTAAAGSTDPSSFDYTAPPDVSLPSDPFAGGGSSDSGSSTDYSSYDNSYDTTGDSGFATGGSFMVGGGGGTDKVPVSFMASSDERVTIETPSQQAAKNLPGLPGFADGGSFTVPYMHAGGIFPGLGALTPDQVAMEKKCFLWSRGHRSRLAGRCEPIGQSWPGHGAPRPLRSIGRLVFAARPGQRLWRSGARPSADRATGENHRRRQERRPGRQQFLCPDA